MAVTNKYLCYLLILDISPWFIVTFVKKYIRFYKEHLGNTNDQMI